MEMVRQPGAATDVSNTYTFIAASANAICASQTPAGAGALTLSASPYVLAAPQRISITCAGLDASRTFTVVGKDADGHAQTVDMAGSDGSVTNGTHYWSQVTSITVDDATAGAITAGVQGVGVTPWVALNPTMNPFNFAYSVDVGTATFTVETSIIPMVSASSAATATIQASGGVDVAGSSTAPARYVRANVSAFTSGSVKLYVLQAGPSL